MREIIFRGKRIDNGEWVEGGIYSTNESELPWCGRELIECNVYIITNDDFKKSYCLGWYEGKLKEVIPKTVGQFTGLTDKNGTKIFENGYMIINNKTYKVIFDTAEYILTNIFNCDIITLKNNSIKGVFVDEI